MTSGRFLRVFKMAGLCLLLGTGPCLCWAQPAPDPASADRRIVINIPSHTLTLWDHNRAVKTWPVAVGRPNFPTPLGTFAVMDLQENPSWENPLLPEGKMRIKAGAQNPLGTRWIGFASYKNGGEYGIHGTDNPASVGKFISHGCVRMHIADSEALYKQVSMGMPVAVTYQRVATRTMGKQVQARLDPDPYHKGRPSSASIAKELSARYPGLQLLSPKLAQLGKPSTAGWLTVGQLLPPKSAPDATTPPSQPQPDKQP